MHEIFGEWSKAKILDLNEHFLKEAHFKEGDFVYDLNDTADKFFIVREGELVHETIFDSQSTIKYPFDKHSWKIEQTTKTIQYKVRDLTKGDYFGSEEILNLEMKRRTRVLCKTEAKIYIVSFEDLKGNFP